MATVNGHDYAETLDAADGVTNNDDTIYGYGGADTIFGLGGNDNITGGAGGDTIDGGEGQDIAFYSDPDTGVFVSLITGRGFNGTAEGDRLVNIEGVGGTIHADLLVGNDVHNVLLGNSGDDSLKGGGGADLLSGGAGADMIDGGEGLDTADYYDSGVGVQISLIHDVAALGSAEGDELDSIENLGGSAFDDQLWGDDGANVLNGQGGADTLKGYGGDDTLYGSGGVDTLYGMGGVDTLWGDAGNDTLWGGDLGDNLRGGLDVDYLYGEAGDDRLDGGNQNDSLDGGANNDTVIGGSGADTLIGGTGADTFLFGAITDSTLALVDDIRDFSEIEGDRIDLSAIDANTSVAGDQSFLWIGNNNAFYVDADPRGQLRLNGNHVEGDINGDLAADFSIQVNLSALHDYAFVL
jgi:Ca2+-binding RTX toxin-like protein